MSINSNALNQIPNYVTAEKGNNLARAGTTIGNTVKKIIGIALNVIIAGIFAALFTPSALIGFGIGIIFPREIQWLSESIADVWRRSTFGKVCLMATGVAFFPVTVGYYFAKAGSHISQLSW